MIAAGGIADKEGVEAALALGAAGVQVGTAYLLCPEATTSAVRQGGADERGRPRSTAADERLHRPACAGHRQPCDPESSGRSALWRRLFPTAANAIGPLRVAAEARGLGLPPLWCGQNPVCSDVPAAELTHDLVAEL